MSTLPHTCLSSTTFETEEVKIKRPVRAGVAARAQRVPLAGGRGRFMRAWRFAKRLDWRKPITVQLRYVHAPDPQVEVRARGHVDRYPWDTAVLDILADVCNRSEGRWRE